jgi:hypothetical protein
MRIRRRTLLEFAPLAWAQPARATEVPATYPFQSPEIVKEMVTVSHGNLPRVKQLVQAQPTLAKASWDWGFGDWETALGAASHVGNRAIAELLLENGAPPTLFSATMLGQLDVVKAMIAANPGAQRVAGPHSISLLLHAKAGGDRAKAVYEYLDQLGDAGSLPLKPLTDEAISSIVGDYTFGPGANDRIEITSAKGQVQFRKAGADARRLFHLGDLTFHPAGASAVRIRFDGRGALTIHDPGLILTAKRFSHIETVPLTVYPD